MHGYLSSSSFYTYGELPFVKPIEFRQFVLEMRQKWQKSFALNGQYVSNVHQTISFCTRLVSKAPKLWKLKHYSVFVAWNETMSKKNIWHTIKDNSNDAERLTFNPHANIQMFKFSVNTHMLNRNWLNT